MDPVTLNQQLETALEHQKAQRIGEAETIYRRILAVQPDNVDALHLLGVIETGRGRPDLALPLLQRSVALAPNFTECHRDLGHAFAAMNRPSESLGCFIRAVQLSPRDIGARVELASALAAHNRLAEAAQQLRAALELGPNDPINLGNYGYILGRMGQIDQGLAFLKRAVEVGPNCAPALLQYSEALWQQGKYAESLEPARRAAEILPDNPHANLIYGNTLQVAGELEEASRLYRRVLQLDPDSFDAHNNLALTTLKMGDARDAATMYELIRARWPDERDALANQSLTLLTLGDFEHGFSHYEARTTLHSLEAQRRAGKLWDGGDIRGKTVLLASEQGLGDTIQFARYAPLVAERGATVIVGCPVELVPVVSTVAAVSKVCPVGAPMPAFDVMAPVGSLPRLFGTRVQTIPSKVPYMSADPLRIAQWKARLAEDRNVKVGIAWAGSASHQNDRARSCRLADFSPLADVAGVTFYALQKGRAAAEIPAAPQGMKIVSVGDDLKDFGDTAALLECLDLLISVDTSVVHMAGALARPVWNLIARGPDWRWMIEREDSPWYPTMRLFRQQQLKNWRPVFERVAAELQTFVAAHTSTELTK